MSPIRLDFEKDPLSKIYWPDIYKIHFDRKSFNSRSQLKNICIHLKYAPCPCTPNIKKVVIQTSWNVTMFFSMEIVSSRFRYLTQKLTRALLGLWIFHRLLRGAFERPPPPMISAPGRRREKRKAAFESSRKIISVIFWLRSQNWGLQGSKFQNFPRRFFENKIFNF